MKLIFLFTKKIQWTGCTQWQSYLFWRSFSTPPAKMCVISCLAFKLCLSCLSPLSCLSCPWWPSKPYDHLDHDDHLGHEHFDHDDHIKHDDKLDPPQPYRSVGPKNITYEHFQKKFLNVLGVGVLTLIFENAKQDLQLLQKTFIIIQCLLNSWAIISLQLIDTWRNWTI